MIVDPGYLSCLKQPNVSIKWDGIDCFVEDGIKLKTGEVIPLDIIIFGTGYSLVRYFILLLFAHNVMEIHRKRRIYACEAAQKPLCTTILRPKEVPRLILDPVFLASPICSLS